MRIVTLLLALAMLGLGAAVVLPRLRPEEGTPLHRHVVATGDLDWTVRSEGRVEAAKETDLAFEIPGRVVAVEVARGQPVDEGDVVARLDDASLRILEEAARLDLEAARAALRELEAGSRPEEIDEARARVAGAKAELEQARRDLEQSRALFEQKALDRRSLEHEEMRVDTATSRLDALEKRLRLLEAGPRPEAVRRAAIAVERAAVGLEEAADRVSRTVLRAPFAGRVVLRYLDPGEMAGPARPVVTISDVSHLEAALEVDEYDVGAMREGLEVRITSRSLPGVAFPGRVTRVGDVVGKRRARGDDPTVVYDTRVLEVRVPLVADPRLRPGMTVEGEISIVRRAGVLVVPLRAVSTDETGRPTVFVEGRGRCPIVTGARDRRDVEVVEGLAAGDVLRIGEVDRR